jgi:hypothetical protein
VYEISNIPIAKQVTINLFFSFPSKIKDLVYLPKN